MATQEPEFLLEQKFGDIEIRHYHPMIIAETAVEGNISQASASGFRRIANFIFGNNVGPTGSAEKIAMTAPVVIAKKRTGWSLHFVMPSAYNSSNLPKPNNPDIKIQQLKSRRCAVLRFSGRVSEEKFNVKTALLVDWIKAHNLTMIGSAELARYNPPWTLPFLRRNEVIIEIAS